MKYINNGQSLFIGKEKGAGSARPRLVEECDRARGIGACRFIAETLLTSKGHVYSSTRSDAESAGHVGACRGGGDERQKPQGEEDKE